MSSGRSEDMAHRRSESGYYKNQPNPGGFVSSLSFRVRKKMFAAMMSLTGADEHTTILDVGVTNDTRQESNFLEKLYPYSENITAGGMENASFLQEQHPGVTYVQADGTDLPFRDKSFDLVTAFAVIEHVENRGNQARFVRELCRVGRICLITTPNRGYPMEVHTMVPFLHWLPPETRRKALRLLGKDFYARAEPSRRQDPRGDVPGAHDCRRAPPPATGHRVEPVLLRQRDGRV
jgi:SAM-dependent methyltransferase